MSIDNKKSIYNSELSILEMLANDISNMGVYKIENVTSDNFHKNLMDRIRHFEVKIRSIKSTDNYEATSTFNLWQP